jgi:hypothetical protein
VRPKRGRKGKEFGRGYHAETNESEGQRYCLNIHGHRAVNYPVLKGLEKQFDEPWAALRSLSLCPIQK